MKKLLLIITAGFLLLSCAKDSESVSVYTLELEKFGIVLNGDYHNREHALATTKGINSALVYAKENGYSYVKFPKGFYPLASEWINATAPSTPPKDDIGIVAQSNMTLDLTDATFRLLPNDRINYTMLLLYKVKNVTVIGGHFIGDRHEHKVVIDPNRPTTKTYEWGHGICMGYSHNIVIKDVKLEQFTGDGIAVGSFTYAPDGLVHNTNVLIDNCNISDCRRHGICIGAGYDIELSNNTITNINGTNPQCGINLEPPKERDHWISNVKIHHNHITKVVNGAIAVSNDNVKVYENKVDNYIWINSKQHVNVFKNTFINIPNKMVHLVFPSETVRESENVVGQ